MKLPPLWSDDYSIDANIARQLICMGSDDAKVFDENGKLFVKVGKKKWQLLRSEEEFTGPGQALKMIDPFTSIENVDLENTVWVGDKSSLSTEKVLTSLEGAFELIEEDRDNRKEGLRTPQVGAIQTILGQWTVKSKKPMTVVLPTGTGKTETMLALFASARPKRLLVLVPSDALRIQLAEKFEDFGVLKKIGAVKEKAFFPIVGRIEHGFTSKLGARGFATACNVIISTPGALNSSPPEFRNELLALCSHLFVDEAHHIAANTWRQVRDEFTEKPVVQFTATPYRTDGKDLGGRLVYNFPLRLSQEQGYFSKINYIPVVNFNNQDEAIAKKALEILHKDLDNGLNHILMARARSTDRADELAQLYKKLDQDLKPVVIHNSISESERKHSREMIDARESRILVCVNMFGEGFDLPSLKIAAIHDPHKTLGVTLQFIGRFARVKDGSLGEASVVVNKTDPQHDKRLRELYAEDNDWNYIVQNLSASAVGEQEDADEFSDGFAGLPEDISLRNIIPKMSTVVYKTTGSSWNPANLESHFGDRLYTKTIAINNQEHVAWLVTKMVTPARWSDLKTFDEETYDLYIFYWNRSNNLLYINSSGNEGVYEDLAKLLCGDNVERFKGDEVYRPLATVKRRVATNVGLLDTRNNDKSFEMLMGRKVDFTSAESRNKTQTNIFAHGFDEKTAENVTVGASRKGRIWSHKGAPSVKHWMSWCDSIGAKLIDTSITTDEVTKGFIKPVKLNDRPEGLVALTLEWPSEAYINTSEDVQLEFNGQLNPLIDTELYITEFTASGPIRFAAKTPGWEANFKIELSGGEMRFTSLDGIVLLKTLRQTRAFADYLTETGLRIICENQALITPDMELYSPNSEVPAYDISHLEVADWTNVDIRKESQGQDRDPTSIQAATIEILKNERDWDVIVDDDGPGENADIVALKVQDEKLVVNLVHCKFSSGESAGARIDDLYELCGQAIKSVSKVRRAEYLVSNLIRREKSRRKSERNGIVVGTDEALQGIFDHARLLSPEFVVTIVQPGVSKRLISSDQLELLAATEGYISDTGGGTPLRVIINS